MIKYSLCSPFRVGNCFESIAASTAACRAELASAAVADESVTVCAVSSMVKAGGHGMRCTVVGWMKPCERMSGDRSRR